MPATAHSSSSSPQAARVRAHRGLDGEHVLAQRVGLGPLAEQLPGLVARHLHGRQLPEGGPANESLRWPSIPLPLRLPTRPGGLRMEKFVIEGGYPLSGTIAPAGNKNAALPLSRPASSPRRTSCCATFRASRTWRRWSACSSGMGVRSSGRRERVRPERGRRPPRQGRCRAGRADPRLVPAGGAAAGPLRHRRHAAARRRRDRPPPARSAPRRVPRPRAEHRARPRQRLRAAAAASSRATSSSTSRR